MQNDVTLLLRRCVYIYMYMYVQREEMTSSFVQYDVGNLVPYGTIHTRAHYCTLILLSEAVCSVEAVFTHHDVVGA